MFEPIYADEKIPLPEYEAYTFRVLQNPSSSIWDDFNTGSVGTLATPEQRQQMGRAMSAFYGPSKVAGLDFATPEAALTTLDRDDFPDELTYWLLTLPVAIVKRRRERIEKNLFPSSDQKN